MGSKVGCETENVLENRKWGKCEGVEGSVDSKHEVKKSYFSTWGI